MANRYLSQFQYTFETDTVAMYGSAVIGGSGAVGTTKGGGITSVTRNSAGNYTIQLTDRYSRFLAFAAGVVLGTPSAIAHVQVLMSPATLQATVQSTGQITIQCLDFAGAAADPESGSVLSFKITMRNSSVGPND